MSRLLMRNWAWVIVPAAAMATAIQMTCPPAVAIMIRHDVPDSAYVDMAMHPDFSASRTALLTLSQTTSGTLVSPRHLLTAAHLVAGWVPEETNEAACSLNVRIGTNLFAGARVFLFPGYDRARVCGGFDVAVLRLSEPVAEMAPAGIWIGGVVLGQRFAGVGQGKTGTGLDNDEPIRDDRFRGFENVVDYLYGPDGHGHWRSDFDNGESAFNTLSNTLFDATNVPLAAASAATPLPLEGTIAAGDSGCGIYLPKRTGWLLAGVATYRWYSGYGGQAGFVNLSDPEIAGWLASVSESENAGFQFVREVPAVLRTDADSSRMAVCGNLDRTYEIQGTESLAPPCSWTPLGAHAATNSPFEIVFPPGSLPYRFFRAVEQP